MTPSAGVVIVTSTLLVVASLPVLVGTGYLALLAFLSRRREGGVRPEHALPVDVVVPAHDETGGIGATVASLLAVDYPRALFRVLVVADNCTDDTAAVARAAGAIVLERHDAERRGKGHALAYGFGRSAADGFATAVVVVDADTLVSPNFLSAIASELARGASCVQAEYAVRNAGDSWRTRLMAVAFAMYHTLRSLGRERLKVSCGLRGNGMAFTHELLRRVPYSAFSIVEDVEYGLVLGLEGVRVAYAPDARVMGEMPATAGAARAQRERWEVGRGDLTRRFVPRLLRAALARRSLLSLDLALDLLVPPLSTVAAVAAGGALLAASLVAAGLAAPLVLVPWFLPLAGLAAYVARGCMLSASGARAALDLLWAPWYVLWKFALALRPASMRSGEWVRTERRGPQ